MNRPLRLPIKLYTVFIAPHGSDVDARRREFILNVLLTSLFCAATVAMIFSSVNYFILGSGQHMGSVMQTVVFWLLIVCLLVTSRRRQPAIAAILLVSLLLLSGVQFIIAWGAGLAIAQLVLAMTIVIAGVLFRARSALIATIFVGAVLVVLVYLQTSGLQQPSLYWQEESFRPEDTVGYIVVFMIIGVVSWLSNRETDRALQRARGSEAALQAERDSLEAKVIKRTQELEELQLARLIEMQPLADIGWISASLVHDIANPLTAASLHIDELSRQDQSLLVRQARSSLQQVDRYLKAARKQIRRQSEHRQFAVTAELRQVLYLLRHRARQANVQLLLSKAPPLRLYGDSVKFSQLIANVVTNAIDAYGLSNEKGDRQVVVRFKKDTAGVSISITDHGSGISDKHLAHLFEPFFSTKLSPRQGLGIGLALVKQYVEEDFHGRITVSSTVADGTVFDILLQDSEPPGE